ncbi:sensor histidine kinase [Oryzibacter oryziterrae]|uniref:sensor histidine kinase n=1 Tax=Oryzibacter oryziterrae TaxID=2766474 RepID=UPI001F44D470|nr:HAMP domain-containing sensor histidine kinase [Oryzibacter oryziterrae]
MTDTPVESTASRTMLNRQRANRRRDVSLAVKDVRERLSSDSGTRPAFDFEILLEYARNRQSSWLAQTILLIALGGTATYWINYSFVGLWFIFCMSVHVMNGLIGRRFITLPANDVNLRMWKRQFIVAEALYGTFFAVLFFLPGTFSQDTSVYIFGALLTSVAINAMVASNLPSAVVAGTIPMALIGALRLATGDALVGYTMAAFMALAEGFFILLAYRLHATALTAMEFRAEKDALIAELEQAKAVSDDSRRRAEEANLAKSRFLATMSHELRTPLNAVLGFSEIMMGEVFGPIGNEHYKGYAVDIHNSGKHLLNLINEILDLSRIEAGRYQLQEEAVNLAMVVEDCHHLIKLRAKNKNITVIEQFEPDLPKIWADERAVRQIVLNLLSNAVKFTQNGGEVRVRLGWTAGGGQYVSVKDNGPGIPENEIPIVMQAFGQGSLAIKTAEQGTGLGLPICEALAKMHGGTLDLRSKLREGTEVLITFPPTRVMEVMPAIREDRPDAKARDRRRA